MENKEVPVNTFARCKAPVLFVAVLVLPLVGWAGGASANAADPQGAPIIQTFPSPGIQGPPFYANFAADFMPSDDGTVGIAFYRQPSCIPAGTNLLVRLHAPAAFTCELTVEGKRWWHDPATDPYPFQIRIWGLGAVPVYFVDQTELAAAAADGVLTIVELQALPSLQIGIAESFEQVIHNDNQARGALEQQNAKGHEILNARGTILQSGLPFFFHYVEHFDPNTGVHTFPTARIDIG
jgi:hypothetical protein